MTNSTALFQNLSLDLTDHRMDSKLISPLIKILPFPSMTSPSSLVATDPHSTRQPAVSQTFPHPSLCSRSTLHLCTKPAGKLCISQIHVKGGQGWAHWPTGSILNPLMKLCRRLRFDPGLERSLEKGKATYSSSILAWRIPWTVQSMGSQRAGTGLSHFHFTWWNCSN